MHTEHALPASLQRGKAPRKEPSSAQRSKLLLPSPGQATKQKEPVLATTKRIQAMCEAKYKEPASLWACGMHGMPCW